ncbi:CheR family methyltransferase [Anoxynatronum buryatiense]|uniref:protein-glutamate O-methyltransferase n=1 Tax=Anoxynatronum buryatiense TaxID=489973 RepID=A0AA45WTP1_9CLOT|nr:protein-glutamate O-methyltransferase CheR [Anoxynatronum buryatiense]SMP43432.1 MCP methyltransferase, CheR-type [Anoxynatronum buryatiense]
MLKISDQEFQQLSQYIRSQYGIKLGPEKKTLITGRLGNTLVAKGFESFTVYFKYLMADESGEAAFELLNKITTNHTYFMREAAHFKCFQEKVLPWVKATSPLDARIWSAGCSRGQEPYTLAMVMQDCVGHNKQQWNTQILATDISAQALTAAREGIYPAEEMVSLPDRWRKTYFQPLGDGRYQVSQRLRKELVLRSFNLMNQQFPFRKPFHTIFCRNVMIYFDAPTKKHLIQRFYRHLAPGGYLFIGHSESLGRDNEGFRYVQPAVYRKE